VTIVGQNIDGKNAAPEMIFRNYSLMLKAHMNTLYDRIGGHDGISKLLRHFYADVRQDPLIGPIFNAQIKDWKSHLEIIASFWEALIGGPRSYSRPMPMRHARLPLLAEHFERWLFLWQANCRAQLPADAAQEMIHLAGHIGHRLRIILGISTVPASKTAEN